MKNPFSFFRRKKIPKEVNHSSLLHGAWQRMQKDKLIRVCSWFLFLLISVAVFADFIAYSKPLYARYRDKTYFPVVYDYLASVGLYRWDKELVNATWRELEMEKAVWPLIRYKPGEIDVRNTQYKSPFGQQKLKNWKERHFMGTDSIGRDVLSGLIHGSRISLTVGLLSIGIASLIGIFLGAFAGYFGDHSFKLQRAAVIFCLLGIGPAWFYAIFLRSDALAHAFNVGSFSIILNLVLSFSIFAGVVMVFYFLSKPFSLIPWFGKKMTIWVDIIISRLIEMIVSIPILLLLISISAVLPGNIYLVMVIIGFTAWTGIARLTRGEMLRVRNLDYIQVAQSIGFSDFRIIFRHALPNTLAPVFVAISFGIAGAILLESSLSFIGMGVGAETVTWGSLLSEARKSSSSWWLATFPGIAIFSTVTVFNLLGESLRDALDPRMKV